MNSNVWLWNGTTFTPCEGIPVSDRGFRYGMALFESLAVREGNVEFIREHLARIEAGALQCGWQVEPEALAQAGEWLATTLTPGPTFARIYLTAGDGAVGTPVTQPRLLLFAEPRAAALRRETRLGERLEPHLPLLGGLKTANYWANVEALAAARSAGGDEALLFNPADELISGCMANVFAVMDGELVTPPLETGARAGVVREWVMTRRPVREHKLTRRDLPAISECFLTSSWVGIDPVAYLNLNLRPLETTLGDALREEFFGTPRPGSARLGSA